jgi:hypothetical protein
MKVLKKNKGEKGVATILVVGVLVVFLIFFLVVAIDFAFIYVVRGQMQNAADAAALAGADLINDPSDPVQTAAREEAIKFAAKNSAAGEPVVLDSNGDNELSGSNDITVGFWDGSSYERDETPVNAIEVRPRRTQGSPGGPVGLFFGKLVNWPEMEVSRIAVATRPPAPTAALAICIETCSLSIPPGGLDLYLKEEGGTPPPPTDQTIAWTAFSPKQAPSIGRYGEVAQYIREELDMPDVCDGCITTNNGVGEVIKELYDQYQLKKDADGRWKVIVPVVDENFAVCPGSVSGSACPPGDQGVNEPYYVISYAEISITDVRTPGGGPVNPGITIDEINCVPCPALEALGKRAKLVR